MIAKRKLEVKGFVWNQTQASSGIFSLLGNSARVIETPDVTMVTWYVYMAPVAWLHHVRFAFLEN